MNWRLVDRFKEPSSWTAIGGALALIGVNVPTPVIQAISFIGSGAALLLGFLLKEGPPTP